MEWRTFMFRTLRSWIAIGCVLLTIVVVNAAIAIGLLILLEQLQGFFS